MPRLPKGKIIPLRSHTEAFNYILIKEGIMIEASQPLRFAVLQQSLGRVLLCLFFCNAQLF